MSNEILEEVWRNRDEIARRCNYDLDTIVAQLRIVEQNPLGPLVNLEALPNAVAEESNEPYSPR